MPDLPPIDGRRRADLPRTARCVRCGAASTSPRRSRCGRACSSVEPDRARPRRWSCTTSRPTGSRMAPLARDVMTAYAARARGQRAGLGAAAGAVRRLRAVAARVARLRGRPRIAGRRASSATGARARRAARSCSTCRPTAPARRRSRSRRAARVRDRRRRPTAGWSRSPAKRNSTRVHGRARGARGAARAAERHRRHRDRHAGRRPRRAPHSTTWSACSSTPWSCARRCDADDTFADLLGAGAGHRSGRVRHADVPFERLVEVLDVRAVDGASPAVPGGARVPEHRAARLRAAGLRISARRPRRRRRQVRPAADARRDADADGGRRGIAAAFTYATDLFDAQTVAGFAERFRPDPRGGGRRPDVAVGDIELLDAARDAPRLAPVRGGPRGPTRARCPSCSRPRRRGSADAVALSFEGRVTDLPRTRRAVEPAGPGADRPRRRTGDRSWRWRSRDRSNRCSAVWAVAKAGAAFVPGRPELSGRADRAHAGRLRRGARTDGRRSRHDDLPGTVPWLVLDDPGFDGRGDRCPRAVTDARRGSARRCGSSTRRT